MKNQKIIEKSKSIFLTIAILPSIKIVVAIFGKIEFLIFYLCELPLFLRVDQNRKKKTSWKYFQQDPRYRM